MNLIIIGPQGSGKGTQSELISKKYKLNILEMGALVRKKATDGTSRAKLIKSLTSKKGELLPDGIIFEILKNTLENKKDKSNKGIIFDGYPRSIKQFILLEDYLANKNEYLNLAIYLDISDKTGIERLSNRLICSKCHKIYNLKTNPPPQKNTCRCGGKLIRRQDDQPEAIKTRLSLFHQSTQPILDILQKKGILFKVNGSSAPTEIFQNIQCEIKRKELS